MTGEINPDVEKRALDLGAYDFVTKPFQPKVLLMRLHNAIARSQMALLRQMQYITEHDALTGLYNRQKTYQEIHRLLEENPGQTFACVRLDVNKFRLINTFWGEQEGNHLLCYMAELLRSFARGLKTIAYGRIHADIFCFCLPYEKEVLTRIIESLEQKIAAYNSNYVIETVFGIYVIDEPQMPVENIFSRASMAARECKKQVMNFIGYYDATLGERLLREQQIINEMQPALEREEFAVYLQPKYNLKTGKPYGAEALVRWNHPQRGLVMPGTFIPVFERNGFIGKLDYYMWEHVCMLLRKWLDEGLEPAPVSVNISRASMYNPNIPELLTALVSKYRLPPAMLNLELTESAYMDNPEIMLRAVKKLQESGFVILMDDFGSGYSSLNTLKDIPVDVLKIDIKFLEKGGIRDGRNERILASVIRMAGWLELPVVVEGVETAAQKEFLESVGCGYVQGFFFARPMPAQAYESFIRGISQIPALPEADNRTEIIDAIWTVNPQVEMIFQSIRQPVAVYEYVQGKFTPLRVNDPFNEWFGYGENITEFDAGHHRRIQPGAFRQITEAFRQVTATHEAAGVEFLWQGTQGAQERWIRLTLKYLGRNNDSQILFATFEDETERKKLEDTILACHDFLEQTQEKKNRLLVVDDTLLGRSIVKTIFEKQYEVVEAENGQVALELLQEFGHDIVAIILDIMMPVMDGRTFLRIKNTTPEIAQIPVVVVSADDNEEDQMNMLEMGVNDYITKPFVAEVMKRRVRNVIEYNGRFHQLMQEYEKLLKVHSASDGIPQGGAQQQGNDPDQKYGADSQHNG